MKKRLFGWLQERSAVSAQEAAEKIEQIIFAYGKSMYAAALRIVRDPGLAEDTVQETCMKIIGHIDDIGAVESQETKALLLTIVKRTAIDVYRKEKRQRETLEQLGQMPGALCEEFPEEEILSILSQASFGGETEDFFLQLKQEERELLFMRYGLELSDEKIAEILGIEPAAERKRLSRARVRLAALMQKNEKGGAGNVEGK